MTHLSYLEEELKVSTACFSLESLLSFAHSPKLFQLSITRSLISFWSLIVFSMVTRACLKGPTPLHFVEQILVNFVSSWRCIICYAVLIGPHISAMLPSMLMTVDCLSSHSEGWLHDSITSHLTARFYSNITACKNWAWPEPEFFLSQRSNEDGFAALLRLFVWAEWTDMIWSLLKR